MGPQNESGKPPEVFAHNSSGFTVGPFKGLPRLKVRIDKDG